jgi:hypothetical protein
MLVGRELSYKKQSPLFDKLTPIEKIMGLVLILKVNLQKIKNLTVSLL